MGKIASLTAYEMIQSGARATVGAEIVLEDGRKIKTSVAGDAHIAPFQTQEVEVERAISYINDLIGPKLKGVDAAKQIEVDAWLLAADKTNNKEKLGVNTIWAISSLFTKAEALSLGTPPFKYLNSLYNKRYSASSVKMERMPTAIVPILTRRSKRDSFDFKEFCLVPSTSLPFSKSTEVALSFYNAVKKITEETPPETNLDVFEIFLSAMSGLNLKLATDVFIGLDLGANRYYESGSYDLKDKPQPMKSDAYIEYVQLFVKKYFPLFLIDPLALEDNSSWQALNASLSKTSYLVGGDFIASSKDRLEKAVKEKTCSSTLIKPAQVGTVTEVLDLVALARSNNLGYVITSSDFETGETLVADLGVGLGADFVKFGSVAHGEDICKYNRMLEIERELI